MTPYDILPDEISDLEIIGSYCDAYLLDFPLYTFIIMGVLLGVNIVLYKYYHKNFISFLKMTAFISFYLIGYNLLIYLVTLWG
jgi:hypothetical protein